MDYTIRFTISDANSARRNVVGSLLENEDKFPYSLIYANGKNRNLEEINNYNYFLPSGQAIPQQFSHYFY
jgi:hypothetical protein